MAKQISYQPLTDIGLNGLNTQSNPASLDTSFLTKAENVVIRESGRIAFRKGLKQKVSPSGTAIGSLIEHNDQGTSKIFMLEYLLKGMMVLQILEKDGLLIIMLLL